MEALFTFIIKSGGLITLFYFAYYFLLRKETFFTSNRYFLLAGLITSIVLPFVIYTKVIWVDPTPVTYSPDVYTSAVSSNYVSQYNPQNIEEETFEINWNLVSLVIYALGFSAFMLKFVIDFYSLNSVLKGKKIEQQEDFKFVDVAENIAPFSYFDYIVYNSSMYSEAELESILEHEKVHSDQNHTIDVIISRIFCILFWFNPLIWLYKKAILQNLEFIADNEASKKISDKKAYQYTLLKITTHETCVAITNHFYQSLIKKRIVMLNKNQSKKWNYWKYYAVLPALVTFVLLFQIKTIAQEKKEKIETKEIKDIKEQNEKEVLTSITEDSEIFKITKNTTDQELKDLSAKLKAKNIDVQISEVERNSNNEITSIKVKMTKENGKVQLIDINSTKAIKDVRISLNDDANGSKSVVLVTDDQMDHPVTMKRDVVIVRSDKLAAVADVDAPAPPAPLTPPSFPSGPMPPAPVMALSMNMAKMPKPPVAPKNPMDKAAMAKFQSEMDEFEKKMKDFEPDMSAYEKQVEEVMSQRGAIFEKQMEQYEVAMQKFNMNMDKYGQNVQIKYGTDSKEYQMHMRQYEQEMRRHELDMKQFEKNMKQHEKYMKQHQKEMKKWEKENEKS